MEIIPGVKFEVLDNQTIMIDADSPSLSTCIDRAKAIEIVTMIIEQMQLDVVKAPFSHYLKIT